MNSEPQPNQSAQNSQYADNPYANNPNYGGYTEAQQADTTSTSSTGGSPAFVVAIITLTVAVVVSWLRTILLFFVVSAPMMGLINIFLSLLVIALAVVGVIMGSIGMKQDAGRVKSAIGFGISLAILVTVAAGWIGSTLVSFVGTAVAV
ncbi:hypothetical protein [Gulosibacter chungangensis]|uniref:Uncharacterized protein n=1 Tax=Gulosibacter chungangensis TaxID=979746 RepID=A0A7J5BBT1_9MICO|nr:hypothetical protein [Gulosibacter chungangensis]KAB1643565.1 hypothetical protein F8O05_06715 [Gulosibacter chungangensis]